MSRAGKSWSESILSLHPLIKSGDEIGLNLYEPINLMKERNINSHGMINSLRNLNLIRKDYNEIMDLFCQKTDASFFVNTLPSNLFVIDIIMKLFPESIILFNRREALDLCLFNFFKNYESDYYYYSYDLETLGRYYIEIHRLMNFWLNLYPHNIIEVNFEDSVSDPIKIGKKLFSQLNLDIDEKILDQVEKIGRAHV